MTPGSIKLSEQRYEDTIPVNTSLSSSDDQAASSPTLSETRPTSSDILGSDQATLSDGSYHYANSLSTNSPLQIASQTQSCHLILLSHLINLL